MLVTFSGLDGAGKSTLIDRLKGALEARGHRVAVFHINDHIGLYAYARAVRDRLLGSPHPNGNGNGNSAAPSADPRGMRRVVRAVRNTVLWSKVLRRWIYPFDLLVFLVYRFAIEILGRRVLIMDRYFYDTLVDVADGRRWHWLRLLERVTPTPDVPFLLDISPEESFARKGEYSVPYLARRAHAYRHVFPWVRRGIVLHNGDLNATSAAVERAVLDRLGGGGA